MRKFSFSLFVVFLIVMTGCDNSKKIREEVKKAMKEDPSILVDAIKAHPSEFISALKEVAQQNAQEEYKKQQENENKKISEAIDKPFIPNIRSDENIRGKKSAPIQLVVYSDFQCPYCVRGFQTVKQLMNKYGDKIQYIYRHLPLPFHQQARSASLYYEAIRVQNGEKAWQFHDEIYNNQHSLSNGESFLKAVAQKLGVDMKKLGQDIKSKALEERIAEDEKEAKQFGFEGTPGYLLNGVPLPGALPLPAFENIISELQKRNKVVL